jgi:hypothetical protein
MFSVRLTPASRAWTVVGDGLKTVLVVEDGLKTVLYSRMFAGTTAAGQQL